jgi:hypothetical protein
MAPVFPVNVFPVAMDSHHTGRIRLPDLELAAVTFRVVVGIPVLSLP